MRGDRPPLALLFYKQALFTPHARGSTYLWALGFSRRSVYPACAGIDLVLELFGQANNCLPRMRGDRPTMALAVFGLTLFTPHARGSTQLGHKRNRAKQVYPACAGIDPASMALAITWSGLPRMRGDRPLRRQERPLLPKFTPHARGSTRHRQAQRGAGRVYPACAGIDPALSYGYRSHDSLPRMRGDRPRRKGIGA